MDKKIFGFLVFVFATMTAPFAFGGNTLPAVNISYSNFLEEMIAADLPDNETGRFPVLSDEETERRTNIFVADWKIHEKEIVSSMQDVLGLQFSENSIPVYLVSRYDTAFSNPLIVSLRYERKQFVPVLVHELAHRLLTTNTKKVPVGTIWSKMFPKESQLTRNHVLVYATLQYVFLDVLHQPEMLASERKIKHPDYVRAWEIVDRRGYKNILAEFRKYYE